ncbi:hypothetical protein M527_09895 [Sphingobium indicum IP26]|uniref:hypothetical protein n=1 Tax=Sphingobium indicum TaxID=332055 RepID=UPI0003728BD6|nr:hypothetical protein M527_09895 [Sphingobium indicum IP26]
MNPITEQLAAMGPQALEGALIALDAVSRPLTVREIEAAMIGKGVSRSQRKILSKAIERLHIIAVVGPEHG